MSRISNILTVVLLLIALLGCRRSSDDIAAVPTLIPTAVGVGDASVSGDVAANSALLDDFENKALGVRFAYPRYWQVRPLQDNLLRFAPDPLTVEERGFENAPIMLVGIFDPDSLGVDPSVDFSDPVAVLNRYLEDGLAGPNVELETETMAIEIDGYPAAQVRFLQRLNMGESDEDEAPVETQSEMTLVVFEEQIALFTASSAESDWETAAPLFAQWLDTVELFEPEPILE